jgi:hypothetical protein
VSRLGGILMNLNAGLVNSGAVDHRLALQVFEE